MDVCAGQPLRMSAPDTGVLSNRSEDRWLCVRLVRCANKIWQHVLYAPRGVEVCVGMKQVEVIYAVILRNKYISVIPNHTLYKQYRSHWAPETNSLPPHVSPLGPPPSWRELATTRGCPDNPHPPTADHNYNPYTRGTITHKYNHIKGPIVTHVMLVQQW